MNTFTRHNQLGMLVFLFSSILHASAIAQPTASLEPVSDKVLSKFKASSNDDFDSYCTYTNGTSEFMVNRGDSWENTSFIQSGGQIVPVEFVGESKGKAVWKSGDGATEVTFASKNWKSGTLTVKSGQNTASKQVKLSCRD